MLNGIYDDITELKFRYNINIHMPFKMLQLFSLHIYAQETQWEERLGLTYKCTSVINLSVFTSKSNFK
jgi:hypothetical protein